MGRKRIAGTEGEFLIQLGSFVTRVEPDPGRYGLSREDLERVKVAVTSYRTAHVKGSDGKSGPAATAQKNLARDEAKRQYTRCLDLVRMNESVNVAVRAELGIVERPKRLKSRACPQEPPVLTFVRALHEGRGAYPMHELSFFAANWNRARPEGAVRLELFIDLVPPDEPVPAHPGANQGGRPWYLRSFTRSPIRLMPPLATVPMRVVYWGRWADSTGNVGPFSATAAGWIEGGSHFAGMLLGHGEKPLLLKDATPAPAGGRSAEYTVAVIAARFRSLEGPERSPDLIEAEEQREMRRIEGPQESEKEAA
jgi:hypothetical protein